MTEPTPALAALVAQRRLYWLDFWECETIAELNAVRRGIVELDRQIDVLREEGRP